MLVMVFKCLCDSDSGVKHLFVFVILDTLNYTILFSVFGERSSHDLDSNSYRRCKWHARLVLTKSILANY